MKIKKTLSNLLMVFLLVSVGYAIGRETAPVAVDVEQELLRGSPKPAEDGAGGKPDSALPDPDAAGGGPPEPAAVEKVIVYYMHGIPCITCTMIDNTAAAVVRDEFAAEVASRRMVYASLNYLERQNESLADQYNVGSNMVIVVRFRDGQEVRRVRLDKVMELAGDRGQLADYIRQGIRDALAGEVQ